MKKIPVKELEVGMIVAEDIYSKAGQLIVRKNSMLTRQMIAHIRYYSIPKVYIVEEQLAPEIQKALDSNREKRLTSLEELLQSEEYQVFKQDYTANVDMLQDSINDIILRNVPVDAPELIKETVKIFDSSLSYFSLFGMLHSMKQIDDSTFAHSVNVAIIARLIGTWSNMDPETLDLLTLAGLLHDIGKCQIPDNILLKPQKLTNQEYEFIKMHSQFGYDIIKNQDLDRRIKQATLLHHERCDGSGYPYGYKLDKLEDFECIISIADVYDAMTADRCYRSGLCPFEVISFFEDNGLQKYHPRYITTFLQRIANTYLNSDVLLSNGEIARIAYINTRLTRPVVELSDGSFLSLLNAPDIYIQSIV